MAKQRLLILLPADQIYGQERALITLAQVMRQEGYECLFLTHAGWGQAVAKQLTCFGFNSKPLPFGTIWSLRLARRDPRTVWQNAVGLIRTSIAFLRIVRTFRPNYLLTGNATFTYYFLPALFCTKIKVIYRHGDDLVEHSAFHKVMNQLLFSRVEKHVANCRYLEYGIQKKYSSIKLAIIYNLSVYLVAENNAIYLSQKSSHSRKNILFVGQIARHKGVSVLLEAFRSIARNYPLWSLTLVGEVPGVGIAKDTAILDEILCCSQACPQQLFFVGRKDNVEDYYRNAAIHVCPSIYAEPSPNVIFEAKYFNIPSVVFAVGGIPELIRHKVDGYICEQIDSQLLADGLLYFIRNQEIRLNAGIAARESALHQFGIERFRRQWRNVFSEASLDSR